MQGCLAAVVLGWGLWWCLTSREVDTVRRADTAASPLAETGSEPMQGIVLWRALTDAPVSTALPPTMSTCRILTLSFRDGAWTALLDPGNGESALRVRAGESIAGWRVERVEEGGVVLVHGGQRQDLRLTP